MTQVIYKIINLVNDKFYVGSTINKKVRFRQHRKLLRGNRHHCKHLQAAWNKYGEAKFNFVVVEEVADGRSLQEIEEIYLMQHVGQPCCYNTGRSADAPWRNAPPEITPNFGRVVKQEQKEQISVTLKAFYAESYYNHPRVGKTHSEETKQRIREAKLANPTKAWQGKPRDAATRKKIGDAQRGKPKSPRMLTEEGRAKVMAAAAAGHYSHWQGRQHKEETKQKLRKRVRAYRPDGILIEYGSLTEALEALQLKMPTLRRALQSGVPLSKGPKQGWRFEYVDTPKTT
jgi:group I intron endonuclease